MSDDLAEKLREHFREKQRQLKDARELRSDLGRESALPHRSVNARHEGFIHEDPTVNPNGCCRKCFTFGSCLNFNCECH